MKAIVNVRCQGTDPQEVVHASGIPCCIWGSQWSRRLIITWYSAIAAESHRRLPNPPKYTLPIMDWNGIQSQISNLSLYDLKAGVRKIQNQVMNYTEMEAKVREATNNEPWGASSSLMQEIANGTFN